jgi:hypothetical protein
MNLKVLTENVFTQSLVFYVRLIRTRSIGVLEFGNNNSWRSANEAAIHTQGGV